MLCFSSSFLNFLYIAVKWLWAFSISPIYSSLVPFLIISSNSSWFFFSIFDDFFFYFFLPSTLRYLKEGYLLSMILFDETKPSIFFNEKFYIFLNFWSLVFISNILTFSELFVSESFLLVFWETTNFRSVCDLGIKSEKNLFNNSSDFPWFKSWYSFNFY